MIQPSKSLINWWINSALITVASLEHSENSVSRVLVGRWINYPSKENWKYRWTFFSFFQANVNIRYLYHFDRHNANHTNDRWKENYECDREDVQLAP